MNNSCSLRVVSLAKWLDGYSFSLYRTGLYDKVCQPFARLDGQRRRRVYAKYPDDLKKLAAHHEVVDRGRGLNLHHVVARKIWKLAWILSHALFS